jgi:hypothetical protein
MDVTVVKVPTRNSILACSAPNVGFFEVELSEVVCPCVVDWQMMKATVSIAIFVK